MYLQRKLHSLSGLNNSRFEGCSMPRIRNIIEQEVCEYFHMQVVQLRSVSSKRSLAFPRQITMYLLVHYTDYNLVEIARFYNKKNHQVVLDAKNTIQNFLDQRADTIEKRIINKFLLSNGYKETKLQTPFVIDTHY